MRRSRHPGGRTRPVLPHPPAPGLQPSAILGERSTTLAVSPRRTAREHWRDSTGSSGTIQAPTCIHSEDIRRGSRATSGSCASSAGTGATTAVGGGDLPPPGTHDHGAHPVGPGSHPCAGPHSGARDCATRTPCWRARHRPFRSISRCWRLGFAPALKGGSTGSRPGSDALRTGDSALAHPARIDGPCPDGWTKPVGSPRTSSTAEASPPPHDAATWWPSTVGKAVRSATQAPTPLAEARPHAPVTATADSHRGQI